MSDLAEERLREQLAHRGGKPALGFLKAPILAESPSRLDMVLRAAHEASPKSYDTFLLRALIASIEASSVGIVSHLIEHHQAPVRRLSPVQISATSSPRILELLLSKGGYDVNHVESEGYMKGRCLLDFMSCDDVLVRLLLDYGAKPELPLPEGIFHEDEMKPETMLEKVAAVGSVGAFKLLRAKGAILGRKTLHRAAKNAAQVGADPQNDKDPEDQEVRLEDESAAWKAHRGPMLRYLVDEVGLQVNAMDVEDGTTMPNTYGPPINWAAREKGGAKVVEWLLMKGAEPYIKDCWNIADAKGFAQHAKNDQVLEVITE